MRRFFVFCAASIAFAVLPVAVRSAASVTVAGIPSDAGAEGYYGVEQGFFKSDDP
jgi:hypothetical protein